MSRLRLPITSKKKVPPLASSKLPYFVWVAPVKEPLTWPNSSLSSSVSTSAEQSTVMNGRSIEPGGLGWYELLDAIDMVFQGPGVATADLVGTAAVTPRSTAALVGAQILLKLAGLLAIGLGE